MATDLELAINTLQAVNRTVLTAVGIPDVGTVTGKAPDLSNYPTGAPAEPPLVLVWPVDGSWYQKGHGYKIDDRTFLLICFVEALGQNLIPQRAQLAVQLLQAMRNQYITPATIALDTGGISGYQMTVSSRDGNPQSDGGIVSNLEIGGNLYAGFTIRLHVRLQWI